MIDLYDIDFEIECLSKTLLTVFDIMNRADGEIEPETIYVLWQYSEKLKADVEELIKSTPHGKD